MTTGYDAVSARIAVPWLISSWCGIGNVCLGFEARSHRRSQAARNDPCFGRLQDSLDGPSRPLGRGLMSWVDTRRREERPIMPCGCWRMPHSLQEAGRFAVMLEGSPAELAARATETPMIPTIGIGSRPPVSSRNRDLRPPHPQVGVRPSSPVPNLCRGQARYRRLAKI